jgi:hypothetical protein
MSVFLDIKEPNVIQAEVLEDSDGEFGVFLVLGYGTETCIAEGELRAALAEIERMKGMLQ